MSTSRLTATGCWPITTDRFIKKPTAKRTGLPAWVVLAARRGQQTWRQCNQPGAIPAATAARGSHLLWSKSLRAGRRGTQAIKGKAPPFQIQRLANSHGQSQLAMLQNSGRRQQQKLPGEHRNQGPLPITRESRPGLRPRHLCDKHGRLRLKTPADSNRPREIQHLFTNRTDQDHLPGLQAQKAMLPRTQQLFAKAQEMTNRNPAKDEAGQNQAVTEARGKAEGAPEANKPGLRYRPLEARSTAVINARPLSRVSCHSFSASESTTIPAPACTCSLPS